MSLFFQRFCITFPIPTGDPGAPAAGLSSPPPAHHRLFMERT